MRHCRSAKMAAKPCPFTARMEAAVASARGLGELVGRITCLLCNPFAGISSFEPHAIRVIGDSTGPVREDTQNADLLRKDVESFIHIAVLLYCYALRIEVVIES